MRSQYSMYGTDHSSRNWGSGPDRVRKTPNTVSKLVGGMAALAVLGAATIGIDALKAGNEDANSKASAEAFATKVHSVLSGTVTLNEGSNIRTSPIVNNDAESDNVAFTVDGKRVIITNPVEFTDGSNDTWIGFKNPNDEHATTWADLTQLEEQGSAIVEPSAGNPIINIEVVNGEIHNTELPGSPVFTDAAVAHFEK